MVGWGYCDFAGMGDVLRVGGCCLFRVFGQGYFIIELANVLSGLKGLRA